jgi:erythromycin esterase-like protein
MGSSRFAACLYLMISALGLFPLSAPSRATPSESRRLEAAGELDALNAATRDLCGRDVVMLGENGYHGDGRTPAFKAALIQQLVRHCHFNAVFFEANHYDFVELARRLRGGEPTSPDMVSAAIGWKWSHDEEIAPLIPFLFAQARAGRVALGGLDDQVGIRGALYANDRMPDELAGFLAPAQRDTCRTLLVQRIIHGYPGAAPHSEPDYARLRQCLADIRAAISAGSDGNRVRRQELVDMVSNIERNIARDFDAVSQVIIERDHSMFLNLRWLAARLPSRPRIIIWAANGHVAKETAVNPPYAGGRNLGSYVREAYGNHAFALGFTAASGSFRWDRSTTRPIPPAPPASLEARALAGHDRDAVYLGPAQLAAMGEIVGAAADDHQYVSARWASIYDGVLVFRAERPPTPVE